MVIWSTVPSPVGDLGVGVDDGLLVAVRFGAAPADRVPSSPTGGGSPAGGRSHAGGTSATGPTATDDDAHLLAETRRQLDGYFAGVRLDFTLPLLVRNGSPFERGVWGAINAIPHGETTTYGEIAQALGVPRAARAVGAACHRNPQPVVVPCHRVVGAGGRLVGFGGGLERKRILLDLEARIRLARDFGTA